MNTDSQQVESMQSTPPPVQAMPPHSSDVDVGNNNKCLHADAISGGSEAAPLHPEFAFSDGNIELQTADQIFWVHEYHLKKFSVFETLIQAQRSSETTSSGHRVTLVCDAGFKGADFCNTFRVIYASHIDGIPDFDTATLVSALRISSAFDYPGLRKFAISKLEQMELSPIQRIQLSDEFTLPSWEIPAFTELCNRTEPISATEAEILGMTRFVEIARIREVERTRWAVKVMSGDLLELLGNPPQTEISINVDSTEANLEYSSGRSKLPQCNCRINNGSLLTSLTRCGIHEVAPKVLKESESLLKQRNELLEQLSNIRSTVNCSLKSGESHFSAELLGSIKTELSKASWVRGGSSTESSPSDRTLAAR